MAIIAQLPEKVANQSCLERRLDELRLNDPDKEYTALPNGVIKISPKYPPYEIPDRELTATLFEIPYGMVVREDDLREWIQRKHQVKAVRLDYDAALRNWRRPDIPYWRVVSRTGCATGLLYPQERQIQKLESEGITIKQVNRSYKVENLSRHLYQFGSDADEWMGV